jgi:hypothetical protein
VEFQRIDGKRIDRKNEPSRKREKWNSWSPSRRIDGRAAIVVSALMALARWFEGVKTTLGIG